MNITIVGVGVDGKKTLTREARQALKKANLIIGAKRMVESVASSSNAKSYKEINSQKILEIIEKVTCPNVVVVMSGDTGFYSGSNNLVSLIDKANEEHVKEHNEKKYNVRVFCGITSIQYLAAKIKRTWQNTYLTSAHGVRCNIIGTVMSHKESFFLTGGNITVSILLKTLREAGFGSSRVFIGELMGYEEERIIDTTVEEGAKQEYNSIAVAWVVRDDLYIDKYKGCIKDDEFARGNVPITKQEVRTQIVSSIGRGLETVIYDVGAGTGSVSVELALANPMSRVYAFEVNPEACELIKENRQKFGAHNLILVEGSAPESMTNIPKPEKVFIGGSKGNLEEIIKIVWNETSKSQILVSAIAVETFAKTIEVFEKLEVSNMEVTQIAVSKTKLLGDYHMLMGQNPIFLISGGEL